jgi:hypothetical protein
VSEKPDKRHFMGTQRIARDVTKAKQVEKGQGTTFQIFLPASKKRVVEKPKPIKPIVRGVEGDPGSALNVTPANFQGLPLPLT